MLTAIALIASYWTEHDIGFWTIAVLFLMDVILIREIKDRN